jgi:ABC-type multidrug transport system ATPase subunit
MLTADCVAKSFGSLRVLTSASLRAVPGQFRVILGRNGAGKSTLLKIAVGWIAPDSGTVRVDDRVYTQASLSVLAKRGVFYWPDEHLLSRGFTVRQQLTMLQQRFPGTVIEAAAEQARVTDLLDERPDVLSGGERRRVGLAAVLVRRPRYLLADEPCRSLDPQDAEWLTAQFRALAESGVAVVATGHEVPVLLASAQHITWCTSGTTHELGAPRVAMQHHDFCREYLGPRYSPAVP